MLFTLSSLKCNTDIYGDLFYTKFYTLCASVVYDKCKTFLFNYITVNSIVILKTNFYNPNNNVLWTCTCRANKNQKIDKSILHSEIKIVHHNQSYADEPKCVFFNHISLICYIIIAVLLEFWTHMSIFHIACKLTISNPANPFCVCVYVFVCAGCV